MPRLVKQSSFYKINDYSLIFTISVRQLVGVPVKSVLLYLVQTYLVKLLQYYNLQLRSIDKRNNVMVRGELHLQPRGIMMSGEGHIKCNDI